MNPESAAIRTLRMPLQRDPDVVLCRNRARSIAEKFGFGRQDQILIATAVSEIARNAFRYARGATASFSLETLPATGRNGQRLQQFVCLVEDQGPGIADLDNILAGRHQSQTGMGIGLRGAHRLMDEVKIRTGPEGTTVRLTKKLPRGKLITPAELVRLASREDTVPPPNSMEDLASRNGELIFLMEELEARGHELTKINEELSETNRGVVALYDELDTIYRVGSALASKLELHELLQAIIDATTEICGAELGLFVCPDGGDSAPPLCHLAGPRAAELFPGGTVPGAAGLLSGEGETGEIIRIDDLDEETTRRCPLPLPPGTGIRSYLSVPLQPSAGKPQGAMVFAHSSPAFFTDRSERILASVALQGSIGIENARLYKSVQSASAAKDDFVAILSHELRNPLNPVFARLSLLEENPRMPADALEDIRLIRSNLELETRLIDDLLDMTRISRGKITVKREPLNLHRVIQAAAHACSAFAAERSIAVSMDLGAEHHVVRGDSVRLQQVFWNLLTNAIKFSAAGSPVILATHELPGNRIEVRVTDEGRGIPPGRLKTVFEPFEQGDHATGSFGGLGLGLAICRSITDAHDGTLTASSAGLGQGAEFSLILTLTDQPAEPPPSPLPPQERPAPRRKVRILLVDDHEETRLSLRTLLELRGHTVFTAGSVGEALHLAESDPALELLISDIGLPDASGHEIMRRLAGRPGLKGIAVSGYGMKSDLEKSREAGFVMHLTKPLRISVLDDAIASLTNALSGDVSS